MPTEPKTREIAPKAHIIWGGLTPSPTIEALIAARLERLARIWAGAVVKPAGDLAAELGAARITFTRAAMGQRTRAEVDVHLVIDLPGGPETRGHDAPRTLEQAGKAETALLAVDAAFHALYHRLRQPSG